MRYSVRYHINENKGTITMVERIGTITTRRTLTIEEFEEFRKMELEQSRKNGKKIVKWFGISLLSLTTIIISLASLPIAITFAILAVSIWGLGILAANLVKKLFNKLFK